MSRRLDPGFLPSDQAVEAVLADLPPGQRETFRWEDERARICARDPRHVVLAHRLLALWRLQALGRPEDVDRVVRGRSELCSRFQTIIGLGTGALLCGRPARSTGRPCTAFRTCWPSEGNLELWACLAHLEADV